MSKYKADILARFTVEFEDNGEDDLRDQAIEASRYHTISDLETDLEIQGSVEEVT